MRAMMGGRSMADRATDDVLTREEARGVLRRLVGSLGRYRRRIAIAGVVVIVHTAAVLAGPALIRHGIDHGLRGDDTGALNLAVGLFLVAAVCAYVLGRAVVLLVAGVGERYLRDLRSGVFRHMLRQGLDFFERERTGVLVSRMTSDIDALQELVSQGLVLFVTNLVLFVGAIAVIVSMSPVLAAFLLLIVPGVVWASVWFRRESNRAYLLVRERIGKNLTTLQEGLAGVRVVQAFAREQGFAARFRETNEAQYDANLLAVRISVRYFPVIELVGVVATALIVGMGGWLSTRDVVTVGTVAAFVLYLQNLLEPVQQLGQLFNTLQQSGAALHKLYGVLDSRPSVAERAGAFDLPAPGPIEVDHVSFGYGGTLVLHDVSLRIETGERLALVGPTGAGKSTLAKLIARFYDPREGAVRIGGADLRDVTLESLRDTLVVVPQEGFLFQGTVRDNVRLGRPSASDAEVDAAIDALGLRARFEGLPDGLDTEVRERGSRLSAGERQLVSLTRAALADPRILVLDEATSSVDPGTELLVEQALERLMGGRTVVLIAHRLSTAARADRIAVVDDGRLVELGTHEELIGREGRYASLYAAWTSGRASGAAPV